MNRLILGGLFLVSALTAFSQRGYFFQSQFTPLENFRDQFHYAIEQDTNGQLYFADRIGLMTFDGSSWNTINTPGPANTLKSFQSTIYTSGPFGFGKLSTDVFGNLVYVSLSDTVPEAVDVRKIIATDSSLLMTSGKTILEYIPASGKWVRTTIPDEIISAIRLGGRIVIHTETGFYSTSGASLKEKPLNTAVYWLFNTPEPNSSRQLIGNSAHELFIIGPSGINALKVEDDGYIKESILVTAAWISPELIAIGTLKGGVVFVNPQTGKINQIINYQTGLPDNEVQTLFVDQNGGLWVGTPMGCSRVSPDFPFRSFNHYPGLEGSIYTTSLLGNEVYVGTNLGAYYLNAVRDYEEITYFIKKNPNAKPERDAGTFFTGLFKRKSQQSTTTTKSEPQADEKKFLGLFGGKKKESAPTKEAAVTRQEPTQARKYKKEVRTELKSITYLYKRIPGIDGRVSQLIELDNSALLASGLDGVFIIENHKATKLLSEAARYTFLSENKKLLLISTYSGGLISMIHTGSRWERINLIEQLPEAVEHIFDDRQGRVWLCTTTTLYWIQTEGRKIQSSGEYKLKNSFFDPVVGVDDDSLGVIITHARGFFKVEGDSVIPTSVYGMEKPVKYLSTKKRILLFDGREWSVLGKKTIEPTASRFLNVFHSIASFDARADGSLWIVTADDRFFKVDSKKEFFAGNDPHLKQIRTVNNRLLPLGEGLEVNQQESFISFHFNLPEFSGMTKVDYRYRLIGLHDTWSEWSPNYNTIEFAYLPPGHYQLDVQARTVFGTEKNLEPVYFKILPPYWKRAWFYAIEFLFFGSLLFLSARLSRSKNLKWQVVNRALAFITVIMVIEFLQTIVQSYFDTSSTPVIDFFVQVAIAFSLLPVEGFMRNRFFQEENKELAGIVSGVSKLKDTIKNKGKEGLA